MSPALLAARGPAEVAGLLGHFDQLLELVGSGDAARGSNRLGGLANILSLISAAAPLINGALSGFQGDNATATHERLHRLDEHSAVTHAQRECIDGACAETDEIIAATHQQLLTRGLALVAELTALGPTLASPPGMARATAALGAGLADAVSIIRAAEQALHAGPVTALEALLTSGPGTLQPELLPASLHTGGDLAVTLPDGSVVQAPTPQAAQAVRSALTQLGTPYVWGGTTAGVGFDCSGLTQWAYREAGVEIPRVAIDQRYGSAISTPQPGDLAVWDGHVAMVIGNGMMVEAGSPVGVSPLRTNNLGMGFHGYYRPTG